MRIKIFFCILLLIFTPIFIASAGLDLSFSDTNPPVPLTDDVVPVDGNFTINVIATAPVGTIAAVEFDVTWTPSENVEYVSVSSGSFLPGAIVIDSNTNTPGSYKIAVATTSGANDSESGVLVTLTFTKKSGEGTVRFGFSGISALNMDEQNVTPVSWTPSIDISLPVDLSSLSVVVTESGVEVLWQTTHEIDNMGFNVLRSNSINEGYSKINKELIPGHGTSPEVHNYSFNDTDVNPGQTYYYRLENIDFSGDKNLSRIISVEITEDALDPPSKNELGQNYPNPCNPETWIPYVVSTEGNVMVDIYNAAGQLIRRLDLGHKSPGRYISRSNSAYWDGRTSSGEDVPSVVYFYTMKIENSFFAIKKLVMLK
ncbi:hypothetical protein GF312_21065 [Candidatus Poribacteria bacterium]|nr:hypothetical protein [Candidatus Poribacteria bacterium]